MGRCVIFTAGDSDGITTELVGLLPDDFVICSDGGYSLAKKLGVIPQLIVGDFDSYTGVLPRDIETIRHVPDKDDTDTVLAVNCGIERGYSSFVLVAATGGRLDHCYANLQVMAYIGGKTANAAVEIIGAHERIYLLKDGGNQRLRGSKGDTFSVLCHSDTAVGICISGADFPLHDATMTNSHPLGVSNRITENEAVVSVEKGVLLIFFPNK